MHVLFCSFRIICVILPVQNSIEMNYEEMLNSKDGVATMREMLPFGVLYKKQIDKKYRYVVELKPSLSDSIVFGDSLKKDIEWTAAHPSNFQLTYTAEGGERGIRELLLEPGSYETLAQLLKSEPATVAAKGFVDNIVSGIFDIATKMHADGVYHLCFAPQNILVRKGSSTPLLLCHGSFYTGINDVNSLYGEVKDYMAPEVMRRESVDERSDIYSIGKLIEFLYDQGSMPFEYKSMVKKATAEDPDARFRNVGEMKAKITSKRGMLRSLIALAAAVAIALLGVFLYMELVPQTEYIEFVEPAPKEQKADPFDDQFDPEMELLIESDTIVLTEEEKAYMEKAEEIYRKRYEKAAAEALSKIYDDENKSASEKRAIASTKAVADELTRQQKALAEEAGISSDRAEAIANDVLGRITSEKNKGQTNE